MQPKNVSQWNHQSSVTNFEMVMLALSLLLLYGSNVVKVCWFVENILLNCVHIKIHYSVKTPWKICHGNPGWNWLLLHNSWTIMCTWIILISQRFYFINLSKTHFLTYCLNTHSHVVSSPLQLSVISSKRQQMSYNRLYAYRIFCHGPVRFNYICWIQSREHTHYFF